MCGRAPSKVALLIGALTGRLRQMLLFVLRKAPIVGELLLTVGIFAHVAPSMHRHVLGQRAAISAALKNV